MWLKYLPVFCFFLAAVAETEEINGINYNVRRAQGRGKLVLYYTTTKISTLTKDQLAGLIAPTCLNFVDTGLEKIEPGALQTFSNLSSLELRGCSLKKIESGVFSNLGVSSLHVTDCQTEEIASDAFDNMKNLETLQLYNNQLKVVNSAWFADKPLLSTIRLEHNLIEELPAHFFSAGADGKAIYIDFFGNKIKTVNSDAFAGIKRRFAINLGGNQLETLNNVKLAASVCIRDLIVYHNKIACQKAEDLQAILDVICEEGEFSFEKNLAEPDCNTGLQEWARQHRVSLKI